MVVMIAIQNSKGEFLMQKRSENKGGDWGVTGGHPKSGESPVEGIITEVKEELTEVRYFSMDELEEMVKNGELNENQVAFFKKCKDYIENK